MQQRHCQLYEFGPFCLDPDKRLLFNEQSGNPVDLTPKVFDTLWVLIRNCNRVVSKKELMDTLWPDSFVEEANLFQNISTLRKVLGENRQNHHFIVTVPGQGYRFVAQVRQKALPEALPSLADEIVVSERVRTRVTVSDDVAFDPAINLEGKWSASEASTTGRMNKFKWWPMAVGLLILAGVLFGLQRFVRNQPLAPFEKPKLTRLTTTGKIGATVVSPDGRDFAYVIIDGDNQSLWIKQVATPSSSVQITAPATVNFHGLTFTPDGNYIYYVMSGPGEHQLSTIYRVPALGGSSIKLNSDVDGPVSISPDGRRMTYTRGYPDQNESALITAATDGTGEQKLASLRDPEESFVPYAGPAWSPDGTTIACAGKRSDGRTTYQTLLLVEVETGLVKTLTARRWQQIGRVNWATGGKGLIFTAAEEDSLVSQVWYVSYPEGQARGITNDLSDYRDLTITRDDRNCVAVAVDRRANLWIAPGGQTDKALPITNNNYDGLHGIAWMPDGRIVFTSVSNGNENLRIVKRDGTEQRQLTFSSGLNRAPAATPDGGQIVFSSNRLGTQDIWMIDNDGSHAHALTRGTNDSYPALSRDGHSIFYRSYADGNPNLFRMSVDGKARVRLTDKITGSPAVSPDGKMIACVYRERALTKAEIALMSLDGGAPLKLLPKPPGPQLLRWTDDGTAVSYIRNIVGVSNIWEQPIDGGQARQTTNFTTGLIFWFDRSPEGTLAFARGERSSDVVLISRQ